MDGDEWGGWRGFEGMGMGGFQWLRKKGEGR